MLDVYVLISKKKKEKKKKRKKENGVYINTIGSARV